MERINIAQVDIDVEALINKSAEVRQRIMEVSDQMKALKDALNKGGISVQEYTRQMALLQNAQRENQREQRAYDNLISSHIAVQHQTMQANNTLTGSIRELGTALAQNRRIYEDFTQAQRESAEGKQLLETIHAQDEAYRELQRSIGVTQVDVGNYRQAILDAFNSNNELSNSLRSLTSGFETIKDKLALVKAPFTYFVQYGRLSAPTMEQMASATEKSSTSLKILRGAIIATGIGALVVVLGSLIAYFTSTQEGINKVNKVLTPLKVVFQTLIGVVQNFGKYLLEAITHPKQMLIDLLDFLKSQFMNRLTGMIDVFKGIGKIITGDIKEGIKQVGEAAAQTVTGVENVVGKVKEAGKAMSDTIDEAVKRGQRIEEIGVKLASSEADFIKQSEALKLEFEEQNQIARDTSNTLKEREIAAKKSIELQKELNKLVTDRKNLEVEIIELKQQSNDTSDKERAELEGKRAEINKAKSEQIHSEIAQTKLLNNIHKAANDQANAQAKEAADKARAHLEEQLKWQKEAVEEYVKTNSAVAQSLQERLTIEEKGMQDRLALLDKEKANGLIKKNEYEKQKREIEEAYLKTRVELSIEAVKKEAEQYEALNAMKFATELALQEAVYQKKVEALEKEKQLKQEMHAWDYKAEEEHQERLQELKLDFDGKKREIETQTANEDAEKRKAQRDEDNAMRDLDFQDRLLVMQEQNASKFDIEQEQIRQNYEKEKGELDELLSSKQISQEEYNKKSVILTKKKTQDELKLEKAKEEAKLSLAQSVFGGLKSLAGEQSALGKAAAIAEATINTYLGVSKAISQGLPMGAVMAAITLATGMMNVAKIASTDVKYEKGGLLKGNSHSEGGIPFTVAGRGGFEAEGGEYIVNKRATAMYFPVLEAINRSAGYGNYNPVYMAAGGVIKQVPIQSEIKELKFDFEQMMNVIREGAMQGTLQGSQQGAFEGARAGSLEGSMQGAFEGATIGTTSGLTDSILRISDNERARQSASI
ncbi:chromosome segregation ATPase [Capnocytophaga sp. 051621]|jgi:chromosome segregation ATPase-like protein|uniref:Chromosome segregation ATPase n=1 Tax=Capnocytophaga periodontitidis TaxID=2795027 RepID=A0ABS0SKK6_9FLAO|nr:chromosome segregation ATPase [Capnocytophaga periodontitidis]MBI1646295.1 chromosome segregation ATPase [Capnocytophaga periodontitidis]